VIAATWSALQVEESIVDGAGPVAGDHGVEEFLAPELLAPSLRSLFEKAGDALDHAIVPRVDVTRLKSLSEEQPELEHWYGDLAQAFGVVGLTLLVSPSVTFDVVAARSSPPTIVFGEALLERGDREAVTFLFYRALKLVQAKMCAIANAAPTERELYLNAFLKAFVNDFQPSGNQLGLLPLALRIQGDLPEGALEQHGSLARAATQDVGHRTAQIGAALERWVSRTALFAVGNPAAALRGLALQTGAGSALPENPTERVKWAMRTPAARELVVFSASKEYDAARLQVGLGLDDQVGLGLDEIDNVDELDVVDEIEEVADEDVSDL
jgi:hypothetical protein